MAYPVTKDAADEGLLKSVSSSKTKLSSRFARSLSLSVFAGTDFTVMGFMLLPLSTTNPSLDIVCFPERVN